MILLHPLQSRQFQFSLALLEILGARRHLDRNSVTQLSAGFCLDSITLDEIMAALCTNGFVELFPDPKHWKHCQLSTPAVQPHMPAGTIERAYLQYILSLPEAKLFLDTDVRQKLTAQSPDWYNSIKRFFPRGEGRTDMISGENFRTILAAIHQGRTILYRYRTKGSRQYQQTECVPWKLEYSAYDRRWWILLYDIDEERTIKSVLGNLQDVQLGTTHHISQEEILEAMDNLKMPEPVVIRVENIRNGLERCFLQFETQEFQQTRALGNNRYELSFTYYKFDTEEILRKLLGLGPAVTLVGPQSLKDALRQRLRLALEMTRERENDAQSIL